jgi:hypothetical protein
MDLYGRGEIRLIEGVVSLSKNRPNSGIIRSALTVLMKQTTYIEWLKRNKLLL